MNAAVLHRASSAMKKHRSGHSAGNRARQDLTQRISIQITGVARNWATVPRVSHPHKITKCRQHHGCKRSVQEKVRIALPPCVARKRACNATLNLMVGQAANRSALQALTLLTSIPVHGGVSRSALGHQEQFLGGSQVLRIGSQMDVPAWEKIALRAGAVEIQDISVTPRTRDGQCVCLHVGP